jgi:hypothetical protein
MLHEPLQQEHSRGRVSVTIAAAAAVAAVVAVLLVPLRPQLLRQIWPHTATAAAWART